MIIKVKVKPNSRKEEIIKLNEEEYIVYLKERAKDGKANKELINLLAKNFNVDWKKIKIKNPRSRDKLIEIRE